MSQATASARHDTTATEAPTRTTERAGGRSERAQASTSPSPEAPDLGNVGSGDLAFGGWSTLMAVQQRNWAACLLANQRLLEAAQMALQHELRFLERTMQNGVARSREIMGEPDPSRRIEQRVAHQHACLEQMLGNAQQLYDLIAKPQIEAVEILNRRALASMQELGGGPIGGP